MHQFVMVVGGILAKAVLLLVLVLVLVVIVVAERYSRKAISANAKLIQNKEEWF